MNNFDYDTTPVSQKYETTFYLGKEIVKRYLLALGLKDTNSIIPSSIFLVYHHWNATIGSPIPGTIHLKQNIEYFAKPKVDDLYDVVITITDKYKKSNRNYLVFETEFFKEKKLYCKQITTYLWGFANGS